MKDQHGQRYTKLHCQTCDYRSWTPGGNPDALRVQGWLIIRHPFGRTVIAASVPQAPLPNATTGFDFVRGCLIPGDDDTIDLVYGSRLRVTDAFWTSTWVRPSAATTDAAPVASMSSAPTRSSGVNTGTAS